jgi:GNAT superfamily N-acetyltransferase
MSEIVLTLDDPFRPEALALADEFWILLGELYGDEGENQLLPAQISGERCVFIMAWQNGEAVGCGAVRPFPYEEHEGEIGEIKRIFVTHSARRQGIARLIMTRLEDEARRLGYTKLKLETGEPQADAIALYEREGWHRIPPYGTYANDPECICFGKSLDNIPKPTP